MSTNNHYDIVIAIVTATLLFLLLTSFSIAFLLIYQRRRQEYYKEKADMQNSFQREILKTQLETQELTFKQIGEEIHDNIGQLLSSTKMLLGITERSLSPIPDTLKTAEETLGKAIHGLRALSKTLNKEWLYQFNLIENLQAEINRINDSAVIQATLISSTSFLPLPSESQVMLFRIIQEALQNSIKHSEAKTIEVLINFSNEIEVVIRDNGKGFQSDKLIKNGVGIINMQHRTDLLQGRITWNNLLQGTEIHILLPVQTKDI